MATSDPPPPCAHATCLAGPRVQVRTGPAPTEVCAACGVWRVVGRDDWWPADQLASAMGRPTPPTPRADALAVLERLAREATPGPWAIAHEDVPYGTEWRTEPVSQVGQRGSDSYAALVMHGTDAAFIAAANPAAVLALVARVRELESQRDYLDSERRRYWRLHDEACDRGLAREKELQAAEADRAALLDALDAAEADRRLVCEEADYWRAAYEAEALEHMATERDRDALRDALAALVGATVAARDAPPGAAWAHAWARLVELAQPGDGAEVARG